MELKLTLNGTEQRFEAKRSDSLLDVLRRNGYTGSKRGCDTGDCGFCTVIVDGEAQESCVVPAKRTEGATVETIESLGTQDDLHPVQEAFVDNTALQCGFCTPGMIMATTAHLRDNPDPTEAEAREAVDDVLCRCTGYKKIVEAVQDAADRMEQGERVAPDGGMTDDGGGDESGTGGEGA
ncbi:MAG: carbon-monoxide dehydrogenase small subunit [Halobacteriales archaeon]|jgi:carbon-monoxide dehydrogenase small subunit